MALFAAARQGRKDDAELGKGVWRRAHDRFRRGLDRFHQILEGVQDERLHTDLVPVANTLADLLPRVRAVCTQAQRIAPSADLDVPSSEAGYLSEVHRALSRAGNALATTAEAVAMARLDGGKASIDGPDTGAGAAFQSVERRAATVTASVEEAERLLVG
ncbi:hypothetical protein [Arthrobacter castelli]|uniref:hypothetical protein n=1 Tax=Arthrobacter castelli TaxID=271431 RepID=UPI00041A7505|nr:hypothetical protein [Arthrobacter castelli]